LDKSNIFNTNQGPQFTCIDFTSRLEKEGIQISMDRRGRIFDNIFVERLWGTVKYKDIYLKSYTSDSELTVRINKYFLFYNQELAIMSLGYKTPHEVHCGGPLSTQMQGIRSY